MFPLGNSYQLTIFCSRTQIFSFRCKFCVARYTQLYYFSAGKKAASKGVQHTFRNISDARDQMWNLLILANKKKTLIFNIILRFAAQRENVLKICRGRAFFALSKITLTCYFSLQNHKSFKLASQLSKLSNVKLFYPTLNSGKILECDILWSDYVANSETPKPWVIRCLIYYSVPDTKPRYNLLHIKSFRKFGVKIWKNFIFSEKLEINAFQVMPSSKHL